MLRKRIRVTGVVQGVGFRPHVWRCANATRLTGWVCNDASGVTIEIQGSESGLAQFLLMLRESSPPLARIDSLTTTQASPIDEQEFCIVESSSTLAHSTLVSPDLSICDQCLREMRDASDRRHLYPFINCTNCGPRFTIIQDIPYDRPLTTMKSFPMCQECRREYSDPNDRRFHAQPNACPACGPTIWIEESSQQPPVYRGRPDPCPTAGSTVARFRDAVQRGEIIAVKGIGGFHLACDATNQAAVRRLRERKGHIDKPFAVMVRDLAHAEELAIIGNQERKLLTCQQRPIVLLPKKRIDGNLSEIVCDGATPQNDFIGIMLPYSPLHYLLIDESPLIMTSGNVAEEPIVRTNEEAIRRLSSVADRFLLHDRDIHIVCDDSVVRSVEAELLPIRRSRGYAPMPVELEKEGANLLAVGGELKSTFCVTNDHYAFMSQHVGDMGNLETLEAMERSVEHFLGLFRVEPEAVCTDLHQDYLSSRWAADFAAKRGVPLIRVQHHYAHVVSLIAEHQLSPDREIIGCCFDGTGLGTDGAIWGGEFLIANGSSYERFAHLRYSPLPGGDTSIRRPSRVALAYLHSAGIAWSDWLPSVAACSTTEREVLRQQLEKDLGCISTSSMGRLFDAVASLIDVRHKVNYEAQAAMEMESLAAMAIDNANPEAYSLFASGTSPMEIDFSQSLRRICSDVKSGIAKEIIAAQFHFAIANMVTDICRRSRAERRINVVGLTGGVFQNALLLRLTRDRLLEAGFDVLTHSIVPPNDAGIALGQAVAARNQQWRTSDG